MRSLAYERHRKLNSILARIDASYLCPEILAKPTNAAFSIGTACDLKCLFCVRQYVLPVDSGFMGLEDFARRVPDMTGTHRASLFGLGDPLLNREFIDYVRLCHEYGIETCTTTHAMHLTPDLSDAILAEGMEEIGISLDAADQPLLDQLREKSDLERIRRNVRYLADRKRERNLQYPAIILTCTTSLLNMHQMPALVQFAADAGAEGVCFSDMIAIRPEFVQHTIREFAAFNVYFKEAEVLAGKLGLKIAHFNQKSELWRYSPLPHEGLPHGCAMAWDGIFVERRGETRPCCYLAPEHNSFFEHPLKDILHSEEKVAVRSGLIASNIGIECRGCYSLIPNSRPRAESCLAQAEIMMSQSELISEADRTQLKSLLAEYRSKLDVVFPVAAAIDRIPPSLLRRLARRSVPQPVRFAFRRFVDRWY